MCSTDMQHTPVVDFQDTPSSENKDSEMGEYIPLYHYATWRKDIIRSEN